MLMKCASGSVLMCFNYVAAAKHLFYPAFGYNFKEMIALETPVGLSCAQCTLAQYVNLGFSQRHHKNLC